MDIVSRQEAKERGLKFYFTGKACKHGHVVERSVNSGCLACQKAYQQTPEYKAARKAYHQKPERKAAQKAYQQTPEYKAYQKEYRKAYSQTLDGAGGANSGDARAAQQAEAYHYQPKTSNGYAEASAGGSNRQAPAQHSTQSSAQNTAGKYDEFDQDIPF